MTAGALVPEAWGLLSVLALLGGLGRFLWGLEQLSDGMRKVAGQGLRLVLGRLTRTRLAATLVGVVLTAILQSSTATTVVLVSLVQAGLLSAARSVGVIMGANVGTTFTGQLIAFQITDYALAIVALGIGTRAVLRPGRGREIAGVLVGAGLMFFGLAIITDAMRPLRAAPEFREWIASAHSLPLGILVGAVFTAVVHSSAATIGILIGLSSQGLMPLEAAVPVLLGANLGTCVTAVIASARASAAAKRVAAIHVLFNLGGILLFVAWVPQFADLVRGLSAGIAGEPSGGGIARQIANAHTLFNVVATAVFLPLSGWFVRLSETLVPGRKEPRPFPALDRKLVGALANSPELALVRSRQALRDLGQATMNVLESIDRAIAKGGPLPEVRLRARSGEILEYANEIAAYQADVMQLPFGERQVADATSQALVLANLEPIARAVEREAIPLALEVVRSRARFSAEGQAELERFGTESTQALREALDAFLDEDRERAQRALGTKLELRRRMIEAQRNHIERVRAGRAESVLTDRLHMEVLDLHRLLLTYAGRIAEAALDATEAAG